jgi:hypothetical protein
VTTSAETWSGAHGLQRRAPPEAVGRRCQLAANLANRAAITYPMGAASERRGSSFQRSCWRHGTIGRHTLERAFCAPYRWKTVESRFRGPGHSMRSTGKRSRCQQVMRVRRWSVTALVVKRRKKRVMGSWTGVSDAGQPPAEGTLQGDRMHPGGPIQPYCGGIAVGDSLRMIVLLTPSSPGRCAGRMLQTTPISKASMGSAVNGIQIASEQSKAVNSFRNSPARSLGRRGLSEALGTARCRVHGCTKSQ